MIVGAAISTTNRANQAHGQSFARWRKLTERSARDLVAPKGMSRCARLMSGFAI
jgi:hypothetical protein